MNSIWSLPGLPVITIPTGVNNENLPYSLQIIGNFGEDEKLLQISRMIVNNLSISKIQNSSVDISIYRKKRDYLYEELTIIGYECFKPQGAFYLFPKSPYKSDEKFVQKLKEYLVLVVPGIGFGCPGYFRVSYCVEDSELEGSIYGFKKAFESTE